MVGVPPWVGLDGFLEQTSPFLLHLANRVVYENAFWLCAKINSACSLLGKKSVCVCGGGVLGEKWAGHLLVTGGPGQGGHAEEAGLLCPASRLKIHSLSALCLLLWNQAIQDLNSSASPPSLEPFLRPQQDSELYVVPTLTTVCLLRVLSTILSRWKQIKRKIM